VLEARRVELIKRERLEAQRQAQEEEKRLKKIADHEGAMSYFTELIKVRFWSWLVCAGGLGLG
jgi:hypothetical protein